MRNLVTNVLEHESIITTHAKAIAARDIVQDVITRARRLQKDSLTPEQMASARERITQLLYKPDQVMSKLEEIAKRPVGRQGAVRVLRLEPRLGDNAKRSILELVNGKFDMSRALAAKAVARSQLTGEPLPHTILTQVAELTATDDLKAIFDAEVDRMRSAFPNHENVDLNAPVQRKRAPIKFVSNPLAM